MPDLPDPPGLRREARTASCFAIKKRPLPLRDRHRISPWSEPSTESAIGAKLRGHKIGYINQRFALPGAHRWTMLMNCLCTLPGVQQDTIFPSTQMKRSGVPPPDMHNTHNTSPKHHPRLSILRFRTSVRSALLSSTCRVSRSSVAWCHPEQTTG